MLNLLKKQTIKFIDLTHTLNDNIPHWHEGCGFQNKVILDYNECSGDQKWRVRRLEMFAGIGTHMDAPSYCVYGGYIIALPIKIEYGTEAPIRLIGVIN